MADGNFRFRLSIQTCLRSRCTTWEENQETTKCQLAELSAKVRPNPISRGIELLYCYSDGICGMDNPMCPPVSSAQISSTRARLQHAVLLCRWHSPPPRAPFWIVRRHFSCRIEIPGLYCTALTDFEASAARMHLEGEIRLAGVSTA